MAKIMQHKRHRSASLNIKSLEEMATWTLQDLQKWVKVGCPKSFGLVCDTRLDGIRAFRPREDVQFFIIEKDNQVQFIPKQIGRLPLTKIKILGCNRLESLPVEIGNISCLERLTIIECPRISQIHWSIGCINRLKCVWINDMPSMSSTRIWKAQCKQIAERERKHLLEPKRMKAAFVIWMHWQNYKHRINPSLGMKEAKESWAKLVEEFPCLEE